MAKRLIVAACLCILLSAVESHGGGIHSSRSHNRMIQSAFSSTLPSLPSLSYYTHHTKLSPRCNHQLLRPTTNTFNCISSQSIILLHKQQQRVNVNISNLYLSSSASPTQEEEVTPTKLITASSSNSKSNDNDNDDDETS